MSMHSVVNEPIENISFEELVDLLATIFIDNGTSESVGNCLAQNCASAERDGALSHGVFRVPGYVSTLKSGWVDGRAEPVVSSVKGSVIYVDACNGFAQPATKMVRPHAIELARSQGMALVCTHDSHHFGALWPDLEPLALEGFVALTFVNGSAVVAAHGGVKPVYGTNPMAFTAPREGKPPLIFDQASSGMSLGDTRIAAQNGQPLPDGIGIDSAGQPTTDPNQVISGGALLPFGGHKGSSIAMMIEILAGALTGSSFSFEVDRSAYVGAQTSRCGQTMIIIDPAAAGGTQLSKRVETLAKQLVETGQTRLPGDHRYICRAKAEQNGIPIKRSTLSSLRSYLLGA